MPIPPLHSRQRLVAQLQAILVDIDVDPALFPTDAETGQPDVHATPLEVATSLLALAHARGAFARTPPIVMHRCQGEQCGGLAWPASILPHPRTCLADPSQWPGLAALALAPAGKPTPVTLDDEWQLVTVGDLSDCDEYTDPEIVEQTRLQRTVFSWVVRFSVRAPWVADGFDCTDDRALDMLAHTLPYANIGEDLAAVVLAAPHADIIARTQGDEEDGQC